VLRSEALGKYQESSQRTSENVRQLAFAALAAVWIFKPADVSGRWGWPRPLVAAGVLATAALIFDFAQYFVNTAAWGWFHRRKEKAGTGLHEEILTPRWMNWPATLFFWLKAGALVSAYVLLLYVVSRHLART
jgi:hypothetical protein